jgi:uncharacterized protein (TIGR03435 family)
MIANHLWQSTLFAAFAAALAFALRNNRPTVRYWIWMAASLKFLLPFTLLVGVGSILPAPTRNATVLTAPSAAALVESVDRAFTIPAEPLPRDSRRELLLSLWACGFLAVVARWRRQWRRVQTATAIEPGIFGIFRPRLMLPAGIEDRLTPEQLRAVIAHELCHVRRRDNLFAAVHMVVQALFWFHPLVWWIGARLIEERERACDEEVLRHGVDPEAYASGILEVCKLYLETRLFCVSGVTGADLKRRIQTIMAARLSHSLTLTRKAMLATAATVAVALPLLIGIVRAQQDSPTFEVASVKPADPSLRGVRMGFTPGGGVRIQPGTLLNIIMMAYDLQRYQISGAPAWIESEQFVIEAKGSGTPDPKSKEATAPERDVARRKLQALLADRFRLVVRHETKEAPVYALFLGKNGHKLRPSDTGFDGVTGTRPGQLKAEKVGTDLLARMLSMITGRPVQDRTGLKGTFAFDLEWAPDLASLPSKGGGPIAEAKADAAGVTLPDLSGVSIFTAVQEQLGLRMEATRGPVESIAIERVERPTAN